MRTGATVAVTGAASGIGQAVTTRLLADDARVFGMDADREALGAVSAGAGDRFVPILCDVSDPGSVDSAFLSVRERSAGLLDGLVNAAGIGGEP